MVRAISFLSRSTMANPFHTESTARRFPESTAMPVTYPPPPLKLDVPALVRVSVLTTVSLRGSMNQTTGELVEAATTMVSSPPVESGAPGPPSAMIFIHGGAPALPLPLIPTSTTAIRAAPSGPSEESISGRYIFCLPSTVTIPKAPVDPAAGACDFPQASASAMRAIRFIRPSVAERDSTRRSSNANRLPWNSGVHAAHPRGVRGPARRGGGPARQAGQPARRAPRAGVEEVGARARHPRAAAREAETRPARGAARFPAARGGGGGGVRAHHSRGRARRPAARLPQRARLAAAGVARGGAGAVGHRAGLLPDGRHHHADRRGTRHRGHPPAEAHRHRSRRDGRDSPGEAGRAGRGGAARGAGTAGAGKAAAHSARKRQGDAGAPAHAR